jgi:hypothetical protein
VLYTSLPGRVPRTYNQDFFYVLISPMYMLNGASRLYLFYYCVSVLPPLCRPGLCQTVAGPPCRTVSWFCGVRRNKVRVPFLYRLIRFDIARFDIDPDSRSRPWYIHGGRSCLGAVPPTAKPLVIRGESDKSGAPSEQNLLRLVMRRKQELLRPKLLRPCMNTKQNDLMKRFFAQL